MRTQQLQQCSFGRLAPESQTQALRSSFAASSPLPSSQLLSSLAASTIVLGGAVHRGRANRPYCLFVQTPRSLLSHFFCVYFSLEFWNYWARARRDAQNQCWASATKIIMEFQRDLELLRIPRKNKRRKIDLIPRKTNAEKLT